MGGYTVMGNAYTGTLEVVQAAADKIYVNMLRQRAAEWDGTLYDNVPQRRKIIAREKSDAQLKSLPYLGRKGRKINKNDGFTYRWATPKQRADDESLYWIPKHNKPLTVVQESKEVIINPEDPETPRKERHRDEEIIEVPTVTQVIDFNEGVNEIDGIIETTIEKDWLPNIEL